MKKLLGVFVVGLVAGIYAQSVLTEQKIEAQVLVQSDKMWDGTPLPPYPAEKPQVTILKVSIPPGMKLPMHKHPVINAGYMLSGELRVHTEEGATMELVAGDVLIELVNKWHYGENTGDETVEIIVFYAGTEGAPLSVKSTGEEVEELGGQPN